MKYERLTKIIGGVTAIKTYTGSWCAPFDADETRAVDRLAELENKIEQGTLIELPCKVGDTVYFVCGYNIAEYKVCEIWYDGILFQFRCYNDEYANEHKVFSFFDERIGKTVFLTREEAEKRLKELQE